MISEGIFINGEKVTFNPENILNGDVSAYTEAIGEATQDWLDEHLEPGGSVPIDDTLSIAGAAADAKAAGDAISELNTHLTATNAELADVRVGADGVTYNSAGAAVRGQINSKLPIKSKEFEKSEITETALIFPNVGKLSTTGELMSTETAYSTTDYIDLTDVTGIYRTGTTVKFALWIYCFYDSDHNFLGYKGSDRFVDYTIETYNGNQVTWLEIDDYPNAKYVRISWVTSRPYTYYTVNDSTVYKFDIPHITVNNIEPLKFYGKTIVNFGDSLFGNFRDTNDTTDKSISKMIAEATGATVYNCGFGGCRMAAHSQYWKAFSMYALSDAITTGIWTDQDAAIAASPSGMPSYFANTLALLKTIDFSKVDYITIGYGTNDYTGNIFITGQEATFANEWDYFKGALRYSIRTILNVFPSIRIVVISPCWRWFVENGAYSYSSDDQQSKNTRDYMLTDYVDACKEVCEEYHIPYIDTYTTLGFNEYTHLTYFPSADGTHMNQSGRQLRADRIVGQINSLF